MIAPNLSRTRWLLFTLLILGGLLSVSAQETPLTLPDVPTVEPTPGVLPTTEWRGFDDPSSDSLGLPSEQTGGEVRKWRGSRAPAAADEIAAVIRDPAGNDVSEAFDFVGAYPWHQAGYTGGGSPAIKIALIDFGFGTNDTIPNARKPELICLSSYPNVSMAAGFGSPSSGDTGRGLDMAEVICDIAPDAKITLYEIKTSARLYDAISEADSTHDIIVIGADFGASFSPGDGTFGRSESKNVYTALQTAQNEGAIIIVAAGNANQSYKSFSYTNTASSLNISAKAGDTVDISWSDWDSTPAGGAPREDISAALSGAGFSTQTKPARGSGNPAYQWTVPDCSADGNGFCALTLTLNSLTGDVGSVVVQVSVSGIGRSIGNPTAGTVLPFSGTLSRPADSPHVISVGAVCADRLNAFPPLGYSGQGPVFAAGGNAPTIPSVSYMTANLVKPDVSSFAQVSITNNSVSDLTLCTQGFSGTQAAAAHLAGMAALMRQNPVNAAFLWILPQPDVLSYLRTHSIDLPLTNPDGFDYETGAGISVLGSPTYDNDAQFGTTPLFAVPDNLPSGACTGGDSLIDAGDILYVGPYNTGSPGMNGTVGAPLNSLGQAIGVQAQDPSGNKCVIVLPGETVTPLVFQHANGVKVFGYNSITSGNYGSSQIYVNNVADGRVDANFRIRRAALVVEDMPNWYWSGFTFHGSQAFSSSLQPYPQAVALDNADGATFANNVLNDFPILSATTLVEIFNGSAPVSVRENSFLGIRGTNLPGVVIIQDSGTSADRVMITNNLFDGISNASGSWSFVKNPNALTESVTAFFTPILHTLDSYTTIQSNTFTNNESETLINFLTRTIDSPYETAIIGNLILNNTIRTYDTLDNAGPLISGFFARRIYILNNSIVNNTLTTTGDYALLFGRGDADPDDAVNGIEWNGSLTSVEAAWEIHGNFIYDNGGVPMVGDTDPNYSSAGCKNLAGATDGGATRNWLYNLTTGLNVGQCAPSLIPANGNITINPYNVGVATYIMGGDDPTDPLYYALTGNPSNPTADGVDEGYDSLITSLFPSFANGRDARNAPRRIDGDVNSSVLIDIGAFEFTGASFAFSLTTPANNAILANISAGFTWTPAPSATVYTFELKKIENNSPINLLTIQNLTPAADGDGLTCTVGCLLNLTPDQQNLLSDGGLFRWVVYASDGVASIQAGNAPYVFSLPTGVALPLLNSGFETQGATPKTALSWKTTKKQGDDIRKCGVGFGANGSNCSFQLKANSTAIANAVKQKLLAPNIGETGDTVILSFYARRKGLVANTATVKIKINYAPKRFSNLKVVLPAGGTNTWEAIPYTNSVILTGIPTSMQFSAAIKGKKGTYWIDDIQILLE